MDTLSHSTTLPSLVVDLSAVEKAIKRTQDYLLRIQSLEGYWVGELEADASVTAGYIPLMYFMTGKVDVERQRKVVNYVRSQQKADGSWSAYYEGLGDINVTIQNYFALKLAGVSTEEPYMQRARELVLSRGGITRANVFTRIWLALFGQFDWRGTPSLPPEIILLPNWFYFNIYEFASWSRATIVALMVVLTKKPVCHVPEFARVSELYVEPEGSRDYSLGRLDKAFGWKSFFLWLDRLFKAYEKLPLKPGRGFALRRTEQWLTQHQEADGSWGGIMLPWVYSLIALSLGYKGVCIAPGGRLALRYIQESNPKGIVAVACQKELEEGICGVKELAGSAELAPPIVVSPLTKDGCVDTEVDEAQTLEKIALGCPLQSKKDKVD